MAEAPSSQQQDRHLRLVLESAIDYAVIVMDLDGVITAWTGGAHAILGWTEHEVLGRSVSVIFTEQDLTNGIPRSEMQAALDQRRGNDERWHLRKDGSLFWASGEMMPLQDEAGSVVGFVKILRDRTEQRNAERKRVADAEFLRSVLAASDDCIKVLDLDGRITFMNEGGFRVMEVSDFATIKDCPWPDFWNGAGKEQASAAVQTALAGGVASFRGLADTMAGTSRLWDVQVTPIMGPDRQPEQLLVVSRDVTKASEASERLELALDAGTVLGTWMWHVPNDRLIGDNRFARSFSIDPDRMAAGVPLSYAIASVHCQDRPGVEALIAKATEHGGLYRAEYRVNRPDGTSIWVEATGQCYLDEAGRAVRFPGILIDVDRRKLHEIRQAALLELGERLRALRDTANITEMAHAAAATLGRTLNLGRAGYGTVDPSRDTLTVERDWCANPSIASVAGVHSLGDYGTIITSLRRGETVAIADVARDARTCDFAGNFAALAVRAIVAVPLMQQGKCVAMLFLNSPASRPWTDDEITFARNVADRTWAAQEQDRAEASLRQLNERLEDLVNERTRERDRLWELSDNLLLMADFSGHLLRISQSWTRILGHSEGALLGRPYVELVHPDDLQPVIHALDAMWQTGRSAYVESRLTAVDGKWRWVAWTLTPESDGQGLLGIGRDITDDKAAAAAQAALEEQLHQSQKMEAVGQLTGGLAHDFNNLLTGITGSLDLLRTRLAQGRANEAERYIDLAQGAAKRAAGLTHRLLAFSRQQTLDPRPIDVNRLVAGMEEMIQRSIGPGITLKTVAAADLWNTLVDPGQLENALLNLCINGRDAMPDGGRLTITTANKWLDQRAADDQELPPGPYVTLGVTDNGSGMTPDVVSRAFDPFFTTKPIGKGTGLGLSMIYGFARQSSGQVHIYSDVGHGTTVCLYLPRHLGEAEIATPPLELAGAPRAEQNETVLLVDDDPTVRTVIAEVLKDLGYTAIEASDGASALKVLQSGVLIDLLVTDVGLPAGMNGRQVADAARVSRPALKVLFITGYAENAVLSHGHLDPGMHVLTKPFALEVLASRVKELIESPV